MRAGAPQSTEVMILGPRVSEMVSLFLAVFAALAPIRGFSAGVTDPPRPC